MANQRRSERARHFLDLLRHSQMYEVFINERLALAAGGFKTSDAFEAKVTFLQNKRGKVLGRFVAQAGAKSVSNLSAVLQRTSTLVKASLQSPGSRSSSSPLFALEGLPLRWCSPCRAAWRKFGTGTVHQRILDGTTVWTTPSCRRTR